jgi:hypothetical protein
MVDIMIVLCCGFRKIILKKSLLIMVAKAKIYIWLKLLFDQKHVMRYLFKIVVEIVVTPKMTKNDIIIQRITLNIEYI